MTKYDVPPFSIVEIVTFDANLLTCPLPVPPPALRIAKFLPADESNVDAINYDSTFTLSASVWLTCEIGDGEGGIISRDDGLCDIIQYLARMDRYCRNNKQDATAKITRVNRTDCLNSVPLVFTSEKITSLQEAEEDLQRKFRWLPHFAELPFVFGIAITHDELSISRFRADGLPMQRLFKADLTSKSDVRWSNIVECFGGWYLIDCEYACCEADGDALLRARAAHIRPGFVLDPTAPWSASFDWYQVGLLLSDVPELVSADKSLKTLCEKLLSKTFKVGAVQKLVNNLKSI